LISSGFLFGAVCAHAGENDIPDECSSGAAMDAAMAPYKKFLDKEFTPEKKCVASNEFPCIEDYSPTSQNKKKESLCDAFVKASRDYVQQYKQALESQCRLAKTAAKASKDPNQAVAVANAGKVYGTLSPEEARIADALKEARNRVQATKDKLDAVQVKFRADRALIEDMQRRSQVQPISETEAEDIKKKLKCQWYEHSKTHDGMMSAFAGKQIQEMDTLTELADKFITASDPNVDKHQKRSADFRQRAAQLDEAARRLKSDPSSPVPGKGENTPQKSDITGTDKHADSGGGSKGGGQGGGQQGGGSGGGSPGGGQSSPTPFGPGGNGPSNLNASSDPGTSGAKGLDAKSDGTPGASTPVTKNDPAHTAHLDVPSISSGALSGASTTSSRDVSSSGSSSFGHHGGATPASASAGSGSGGGGGDGAGLGDKHCVGKECQAAGASQQFASVGSLGGGAMGGSLGGLDGGGTLDNLFGDDKKGGALDAGAGGNLGGLDGMASLDSSTAALAGGEGSAQGSGVAGADAVDLFHRMHAFHERAQKRGMVMGITKKL
jgi:uncharacterized membrane protein YgcG